MKSYSILFSVFCLPLYFTLSCEGQTSQAIDPYYNSHLYKYYDPQQIDFHKEYYDLQCDLFTKIASDQHKTTVIDFSEIWLSGDWAQNGVIGNEYQRIQFHIHNVRRLNNDLTTYLISGKSKVNSTICNFSGELRILKTYFFEACDDLLLRHCGVLQAEYMFLEDSLPDHSGFFKGITSANFYLDESQKKAILDETNSVADGYSNRTYVGTWTDYKTKNSMKCIWGDYRLPFTFDFDQGDGELMVNEKYAKNGWQSFIEQTEFIELPDGTIELKDKWWLDQ